MLDRDLTELYQVTTGNLNKAVKRNVQRFPGDFMFQLTKVELQNLIFQNGTSSGWGGIRKLPSVFTEHGVLMPSSVLKSERAIQVNIQIVRTFAKLREMLATHTELRQKIEDMERRYDKQFKVVFDALGKLLTEEEKPKRQKLDFIETSGAARDRLRAAGYAVNKVSGLKRTRVLEA